MARRAGKPAAAHGAREAIIPAIVPKHESDPPGLGIAINAPEDFRVFEEVGAVTFALLADLGRVKPVVSRSIVVKGEDREAMLAEWVQRLLDLHEKERLLLCRFRVDVIEPHCIRGAAWGERIDSAQHRLHEEYAQIKLRGARVAPSGDDWTALITFDLPPRSIDEPLARPR